MNHTELLNKFDREMRGKSFSEAEKVARDYYYTLRIIRQDDKYLIVTKDYVTTRINVAMQGNTVEAVLSIG